MMDNIGTYGPVQRYEFSDYRISGGSYCPNGQLGTERLA